LVADLVERFERDRKVFMSPDYKEEQLRAEFLNPFFESLGWDVANKAGLTEVFKPVIHEESIKVAGATKAPDYTFRIGGRTGQRPRIARRSLTVLTYRLPLC
jgi:hypothetical protein